MDNWNTIIGLLIRRLRAESGLSQEKLAFEADVDRTYISMLERGKRGVTVNTLLKLTRALNVDIVDFIKTVKDESEVI